MPLRHAVLALAVTPPAAKTPSSTRFARVHAKPALPRLTCLCCQLDKAVSASSGQLLVLAFEKEPNGHFGFTFIGGSDT